MVTIFHGNYSGEIVVFIDPPLIFLMINHGNFFFSFLFTILKTGCLMSTLYHEHTPGGPSTTPGSLRLMLHPLPTERCAHNSYLLFDPSHPLSAAH